MTQTQNKSAYRSGFVTIIGSPNVGKSTLLSVTSNAHPKIANYHFTTLYPNLGVIYVCLLYTSPSPRD